MTKSKSVIVTHPGPTTKGARSQPTRYAPSGDWRRAEDAAGQRTQPFRSAAVPREENRLTAIFFLSRDNSLALMQHVNADNGPPLIIT